jgi:hypothetical protein
LDFFLACGELGDFFSIGYLVSVNSRKPSRNFFPHNHPFIYFSFSRELRDITKGVCTHTLVGAGINDPTFCEWSAGGILLSAAKDGLALFDPRASDKNVAV